MPGVAGQVYIDILSRDKLNLDNVGKGAGKSGARAGREYGREWYKSLTGSLNGMSQSFYRAFSAAFNGNGSPFTIVINDMYSNGLTAGKLFADGFEKVFKANMSKSLSSLNPNMKNLARNNAYKVVGQGVDSQGNTYNRYKRSGAPGSKFSGDPYYLLNPQAQEAFRKNKANFLDTYGTGGPAFARIAGVGPYGMGLFSPSRAYRARTFTRQAYEGGLYNNKRNLSLLDAIRYNVTKATGAKGREFQYVASGPARFLGESFNRRLATPDTLSYLLASRNYDKSKWAGRLGAGLASTAIYADAGIRTAIPVMVKGFEGSALTALSSNIAGIGLAGKTAYDSVKAFAEPQAVLYRMKARASGEEDIDAVGRAARDVAGELSNITVSQMTKTAENMQRAGWKSNDIITALPAVGLGANALDKSPEQLVEDLVSIANIFHIDSSEWGDMMNTLAKAANQSPMKFDDIVAYLRQAGTNAYNGGSTLNDALADMLVLTKYTGIQWGANLGTLSRSMQRGVITNGQFLADMGVSMFDENGQQRKGTDLNIAIAEAIRRNNPSLSEAEANLAAQKIYGSYGARGAGAGNAKLEDFDYFYDQITNEDDLLTRLANASRQGISGTWGLAKSKVDTMNNKLGEIVAPSVQRFLDFIPPAIDVLKERLSPVMQNLNTALDGVTEDSIKKTIDEFINTMVQMEENGVQLIKEILSVVSQNLPGVMQTVREIASGLSQFFHNWVEPGANAVKDAYNFGTEKFMEYNSYWNSIANRFAGRGGEKGMSNDEKSLADFASKNMDSVRGSDERGFWGHARDTAMALNPLGLEFWTKGGVIGQAKSYMTGNDPRALNQKNFLRDLSSKDSALQSQAARYFWDDNFVTPSVLLEQYNISHEELKRRVKMGLTVAEALYGLFPETQESETLLKEVERSGEAVGQREAEELPPGYDPFFSPKSLFGGKGGSPAGPHNEKVKPLPAQSAKNDLGEALPLYPGYTFGNPFNEKNGYVADMSLKHTVERMMPKRDANGKFMFDDKGNPIMEMQTLTETLGRTNELLFDTNDEVEKLAGVQQGTIAANPYHNKEDSIAYIKDKLAKDGRLWAEYGLSEQGNFVADLINKVIDRNFANIDNFSLDNLEEIVQKIYDTISNTGESDIKVWQDDLTGKMYMMSSEDYQNGGYMDVNKDRDAYEKAMKKKKKTLSPEEQAERDAERERKAELRAQREFERSKAENARKFEKWKIESQRKWEESMMKAQMANDEAVSGSLGGLDKVFGFDNNYSTEKDWVKAIVNPDLTGQTVKEILGNLNTYGTVNPFEVAQQKTMLNFQELAQRDMEKAMQEERATEMWYEYLQAVTAGGTVSKFEISDSALSFQFQNVPNIEVKDSDLHIEAQKVVASIDEEIKEHVKRIANYCEEQSLPIVV